MYGPQTSDLANALMADRQRHAAHAGLERSARRSRTSHGRALKTGQSITAMLGAAIGSVQLALLRPRPSISAY
jgi:hypothetical protein